MTATPDSLPFPVDDPQLRVADPDEEEATSDIDPEEYAALDARAVAVGLDLEKISAECTLTPGLFRRH